MVVSALSVEIYQLIRRQMVYAQGYGMTAIARHGVFEAVRLCWSRLNAEKRVIGNPALIHAIKSQLVVVATPEQSFADAEFVAMHTLTIYDAVATILCDLDFARYRGSQTL